MKITRLEETPNPAARKFRLDTVVAPGTTRQFTRTTDHPLAAPLFTLPGVAAVFIAELKQKCIECGDWTHENITKLGLTCTRCATKERT